jgi:hypothetical protein
MALFSSGPLFVFTGLSQGSSFDANGNVSQNITPAFLGTGEVAPQFQHHVEMEPVMNDLAGSKIPLDYMLQGEIAFFSMTLTNWVENVVRRLEVKLNDANSTLGMDDRHDRGTLMLTEGMSFPVWFLYGHRARASMVAANMPRGRQYKYCVVDDIVTIPGRRANRKQISMTALGKFDASTQAFNLWSTDVSAVENLPVTG